MKYYVIIDSNGYHTAQVNVPDGETAADFDASTWIEKSDDSDYSRKRWVDGAWTDLVVSVDELRMQRDKLIAWCDYTQLTDSQLTDAKKAEWATYRQALRDLPDGYTPTASPTYPTVPTA